jgi:HEAT repeat protein
MTSRSSGLVELSAAELRRWQSRLHNRLPLVGGWLRRRAAQVLARAGSPAALRLLAEALASLRDPGARQVALAALAGASQQASKPASTPSARCGSRAGGPTWQG